MKRIHLLIVPDPNIDAAKDPDLAARNVVDYAAIIGEVIRMPMDRIRGADITEMRQGIRVLDALERTLPDRWLDLEDADYEHLAAKVRAFPWGTIDRRLLGFIDAVLEPRDEHGMTKRPEPTLPKPSEGIKSGKASR